jgi:uncharacterized membrane protein
MITDFSSAIFSIGMLSGASAFFMGTITTTSNFLMLFGGVFLGCVFGLVLYHSIVYSICKLLDKIPVKNDL